MQVGWHVSEITESEAFKNAVRNVRSKRARIVVDHIIKNGLITTEELERDYGYSHPPRAARDVRESGIPLETFRVTGANGRSIAAYRFGDLNKIEQHKAGGRRTFSKAFKERLVQQASERCEICLVQYESRYLQIDHTIPYEVVGDNVSQEDAPNDFMVICASCQRSKSWSCEHCANWQTDKSEATCSSCYWAAPTSYDHVAQNPERRLTLVMRGAEAELFDAIIQAAGSDPIQIQAEMKRRILELD